MDFIPGTDFFWMVSKWFYFIHFLFFNYEYNFAYAPAAHLFVRKCSHLIRDTFVWGIVRGIVTKKFKFVRSQLGGKNGYISWKYTYETTLKNQHMSSEYTVYTQ